MKFLLLLPLATTLLAHDMWIEPVKFAPAVGEIVGVKLRVGQGLLGDAMVPDATLIREFLVQGPEGRKPMVTRGTDPAGLLRIAAPGLHILGYNSNPSPVELTAEKFTAYLKEEGLDHIAPPKPGTKVRELFSRCAKSLMLVGPSASSAADQKLGFPLELIAERNPYALQPGEPLPVRLTYLDHPLAGTLVVAISRKTPTAKVTARTDANGRVKLPLRSDGLWLIKAVHMVPSPVPAADWSSYWASLTLELGTSK